MVFFQILMSAKRRARLSGFVIPAAVSAFLLLAGGQANAQPGVGQGINENFGNVQTLINNGWVPINHSDPVNPNVAWLQCTGSVIPPAHFGQPNTCVMANYTSIAPDRSGTISNWLLGPPRSFNRGDTISFWTRTPTGNPFGDRLQFRLSTNGTSTDIGDSPSDVGDFTTLFHDINPTYQVGGYPEVWTQYTVSFPDLPGTFVGRFAFRYLIEDGGETGDVGYAVGVDSLLYTRRTPYTRGKFDFDGDAKADIGVFRPGDGTWYLSRSSDEEFSAVNFGLATDRIIPQDYDGDGKTDVAVYRPEQGYWYILKSTDGTFSATALGLAEDLPSPSDFDGDGKADLVVFRPSTGHFYRQNSTDGAIVTTKFGEAGDVPTAGDFDGDGKADVAIYRPTGSLWYYIRSIDGEFVGTQFGATGDRVVPGDYDGDGNTDIAVFRPSEGVWYIRNSANFTYTIQAFGAAEDLPVAADFDGDGRDDISVFRPSDGTWYIANTRFNGFTIFQWGQAGDRPIPNAYSY